MVRRFGYFLLAVALGGLFVQIAWADELPTPKSLWQTVTALPLIGQPPMPRKPWVLREREILLDLPLLHRLKDAGARPLPRITIELFDKPHPELDVTSTVSRINDTAVIRGTFKPPSVGDFTFVVIGNLLIGTIQMGDRLYKIEHTGNGRLQLVEADPDTMPLD
ncbi:MAG TPA: hypothetical protein VN666_13775 [Nitrospira sp.]|nr:hypothetical protein [Nitrospira sp.]